MTEYTQMEQPDSGCPPSKAEGAFVALAAGDALGWPQEFPKKIIRPKSAPVSIKFHEWVRRGGGRFSPYEEVIGAGEYSDDTQLAMAVARCRIIPHPTWWNALTKIEIPLWTLYQRGGGGATKRAAASWIRGTPPWQSHIRGNDKRYFKAGGNGVVMRVIPHSIFFAGESNAQNLIHDVMMDGVATHGHPRALVGGAAYAFAAWWLLRSKQTMAFGELVDVLLDEATVWGALPAPKESEAGWFDAANKAFCGDYDTVWRSTVSETRELLKLVRSGLQAGAIADDDAVLRGLGAFGRSKGSGTITAATAFYLIARYATQPTQAVLKAAFAHGADTDTIAALTGGLAGCLNGTDWLPREWLKVQDFDYLRALAKKVARGPGAAVERGTNLHSLGAAQLNAARTALSKGRNHELDIGGVRKVHVVKMEDPVALSKTVTVNTWVLRAEDGQTLYVTKVGRRSKDDAVSATKTNLRTNHGEGSGATVSGVKLSVHDVARAASFYEEVFGLVVTKRDRDIVSFNVLSLVKFQQTQDLSADAVIDDTNVPLSRIEIQVPNLKEARIRVEQAGGRIVSEVDTTQRNPFTFHCFDLDKHLLEVIESGCLEPKNDSTESPTKARNTDGSAYRWEGSWTSSKLDVFAHYLTSYTTTLGNKPTKGRRFKKGYIDAFSGSRYQDTYHEDSKDPSRKIPMFPNLTTIDLQNLLNHSTHQALKTDPRFDSYVFIEQNTSRCATFEKLKQEFPDLTHNISVRQGDANKEIEYLCRKDWHSHRAVLFLDPYGMQVEWATIEMIAKTEAIDLWLLFPLGIGINYLRTKSDNIPESWQERLNLLLGTDNWHKEFYDKQITMNFPNDENERIKIIGHYFNKRLKKIFAGVTDRSGVLRDSENNPLYLLCFAAGDKRNKNIILPIAERLLKDWQ